MPTKTQIANLTNLIFDKLSTTEYHPINWRTAIYAGLLAGNNHLNVDYSYGNQNTWRLNHSWRAAINRNDGILIEFYCVIDINENLTFHCVHENRNEVKEEIEISLTINDFNEALWLTIGEESKKILNSKNEKTFLFNSIVKVFTKENNVIINQDNFDENNNENEIHSKIRAIFHLYSSMHTTYNNSNLSDEEQTFFQYALGASLFYLPHPERCWDGRISVKVINHILEGGNKVKDHITPRKLAAKQLLEEKNLLSLNQIREKYWGDYSKFTYITTNENYQIRNYYIDGSTYDDASKLKGIEWIKLENHKELKKFIKYLKDKKSDYLLNHKQINNYLTKFRNL